MTQKSTQGLKKNSQGGVNTTPVGFAAVAAGAVVIKAMPGVLCNVLVVTAPATVGLAIFDNATTGSGTQIGAIPTTAVAGQVYQFQMPANLGITIAQAATMSAGQFTVSFF